MPLQATSGAASYDAFGGGAAAVPNYIEDVFSTYLYTGNGSTQTITNGIDLAGEGGLVWTKSRSNATSNIVFDTAMGGSSILITNSTSAKITTSAPPYLTFNSNGFSFNKSAGGINQSPDTYASWTFRKAPKFFDVVTYTGTGANRTVAHGLGSVPGCIMVKRTDTTGDWQVYHRSLANTQYMVLNTTAAVATGATRWNSTTPTSTEFSLGTDVTVNASGGTYVAYIFAHDAGGFGLTGTDNVISCGAFTTDGSGNATVNLGYEPQWVMYKVINETGNWVINDTMRGWFLAANAGGIASSIDANLSNAETALNQSAFLLNPTGFTMNGFLGGTKSIIYIAIRRGPMKVPASGTGVLGLNSRTGTGSNTTVTGGAGVTDLAIIKNYVLGSGASWVWVSRLTGTGYLSSNAASIETAAGATILRASPWDVMDGVKIGTTSILTNQSGQTYMNFLIDRAPGFYDEVGYIGDGTAGRTIPHNLGVTPELMLVKRRSGSEASWLVYSSATGAGAILILNDAGGPFNSSNAWNSTAPTASVFTVGNSLSVNAAAPATYIARLFASLPGVSKVGNYTGNGGSQNIECGFTAGARFILIKQTYSTGDWWLWNSARGIVSGNDPYSLLNSNFGEIAGADDVDPYSGGFAINQISGSANINASGATYIFLAIA
jgi:hypothetical protein